MKRILKKLRIPLAILLLLCGAFWYGFISRTYLHTEKDNWVLDFSHIRMRCSTCTGQIHRLECAGRPISLPRFKSRDDQHLTLITPVGVLETDAKWGFWRLMPFNSPFKDSTETLSADDRARGHYEVPHKQANAGNGWLRKQNTPPHWCLGQGPTQTRWFDPALMNQLEW